MTGQTRRGQPLIALAIVLASWVLVRAAVWDWPVAAHTAPRLSARAVSGTAAAAVLAPAKHDGVVRPAPAWPHPRPLPLLDQPAGAPVEPALPRPLPVLMPLAPPEPTTVRIAAGHQLLWLAGVSQLALPPDIARYFAARSPPASRATTPAPPQRRWSGDAWLLHRRASNGFHLPGAGLSGAGLPLGTYGASQAGAVIRYRLAPDNPHRPALYLRASSGLERPRGEEAALGLSIRPLRRVPVVALTEARVTRTQSSAVIRPAVALVSEITPLPLPLGLSVEAYAQVGWVGHKDSTAFADGQARVERKLLDVGRFALRAGAGAWGGAQRKANRFDLGPSATLAVPLGHVGGRVSADWRFRVAGDAAPGSGPAVTLSAGF